MDDRRSSFHINDYNELELLAALHALKAFKKNSVGISIRLMLDNATAVHYINKSGGSRSKSLNNIMSSIVGWCEQRNLSIHAIHLPGALNFIADRLSREALDSSSWKLRAPVFESLRSRWDLGVDLFENNWKRQLDSFVSSGPSEQEHPLASSLVLVTWRLSGRITKAQAFRIKWSS